MKEQCENRGNFTVENKTMNMKQDSMSKAVLKENGNWQNKSNSPTKCDLHENVSLELFCTSCQTVVCGHCEKKHSANTMIKLSEASKLNKSRLNMENSRVRTLIRYADHVIKDLRSYLEKLAVSTAEITAEILERASVLPEGTELLTQTMIADIQREYDLECDKIQNKVQEFDSFVGRAKTVSINCENLCNSVDDKCVVVKGSAELMNMSKLLSSLPQCPVERCIFILSPVEYSKESGEVTPEEMLGAFTTARVPWRIEVKRIASVRPESVPNARFVTTMCPDINETVWVSWQWGPKIHLVDKEGNVKKAIDVGRRVDDICKCGDYLVVSSHESKSVSLFDSNYELVKTIETDKVPRGVDCTSDNELVLCCVQNLHHKNGDVSSVMKLQTDSKELKDLKCEEHLVQPMRIAVNMNGDICVSDRNKGSVLVFDNEGKLKAEYKGPDSVTRHPFAPHAICCDKFGQIFAVDYTNHTVHVLDPLGRFRGFLIMDTELEKRAIFMGTSSPFSIAIDSVGDVWVGNKFGYLTILKYLM